MLKYKFNTVLAFTGVKLVRLGSKCSVIAGTRALNEGYNNSPKGHVVGTIEDIRLTSSPSPFYWVADCRKIGIVRWRPLISPQNS